MFEFAFGKYKHIYYEELQGATADYVRNVNKALESHYGTLKELGKPIAHRLLELVIYTIPRFAHAMDVSDLVFEHKNQGVKRSHRRGNCRQNHVSVVPMDLMD